MIYLTKRLEKALEEADSQCLQTGPGGVDVFRVIIAWREAKKATAAIERAKEGTPEEPLERVRDEFLKAAEALNEENRDGNHSVFDLSRLDPVGSALVRRFIAKAEEFRSAESQRGKGR